MKRAALYIAAGIVILPLLFLLASFVQYALTSVSDRHEAAFQRNLASALESGDSLDMAEVAAFEWDRMYMFPPYTSRDAMEEAVGKQWTTGTGFVGHLIRRSFIGKYPLDDDSFHKLVFVDDGDVVLDVTLRRSLVDFAYSRGVVERDDGTYIVERSADGWRTMRNASER